MPAPLPTPPSVPFGVGHVQATPVMVVNPDGTVGAPGYTLCSGYTLAAGQSTAPVTGVQRGAYNLDMECGAVGAGSLTLCALGADGVTVRVVKSGITTTGVQPDTYQIMANASLFVRNDGTGPIVNLFVVIG